MNFRLLGLSSILSTAFASKTVKNFSQRDKSSPNWTDSLDDFKNLVHAITFGEEIPSHHDNPLQVMIRVDNMNSAKAKAKNPFELPDGWFGKKKRRGGETSPNKKSKKSKGRKLSKQRNGNKMFGGIASINPSQFREQQSIDDLALLNFLVQHEEPKTRSSVQSRHMKKNLSSLIAAENRYNEIKKNIGISRSLKNNSKLSSKRLKMDINPYESKAFSKVFADKKGNQHKKKQISMKTGQKNKKWSERIDMKGAKNTLTLSVAFGVIATALFCVVVQLFKLFVNPKGSGNGSAFEQINRRSTYGYDKIALDIEDDEENGPSN